MFPGPRPAQEAITAEELIDAANEASAQSRNMWIAFIAVLAYLIVTIAGTTHKDLLLNNPVTLPFLQVDIPLFSFFIYGPLVVLVLHLGLLIQHAMLAFKLFRVTELLQDGGWHRPGPDPRRSKLHAYIFSQLIAGPDRGSMMGFLMRVMTWFSLVAMPVFVLIFFQVAFLPFHDEVATYWHRIAVLLDVIILFALGPYMRAATMREAKAREKSAFGEFNWPWRVTVVGFGLGGLATVSLVLFSWFVATIPDACAYKNKKTDFEVLCLDKMMARFAPWAVKIKSGNTQRDVFWLTAMLFEGQVDPVTGKPTSLWSRNIVLTDEDLVPEKEFEDREVSLSLRGRDLRFAILDRSDLHRVDFTGVDLSGASLNETRLEGARFCPPGFSFQGLRVCSNFEGANLADANLRGVDFSAAVLNGVALSSVELEGTNFKDADLDGANFSFTELKDANFSGARLNGANFDFAQLGLANFEKASLVGASFSKANLQGANFNRAQLAGAIIQEADMRGAQLEFAKMIGADLSRSKLDGAFLKLVDLRAANLEGASLVGADLRYSKLYGAQAPDAVGKVHLALTKNLDLRWDREDFEDKVRSIDPEAGEDGVATTNQFIKKVYDQLKSTLPKLESDQDLSVWRSVNGDEVNSAALNGFLAMQSCKHVLISEGLVKRLLLDTSAENGPRRRNLSRALTSRICDTTNSLKRSTKLELCQMAQWNVSELDGTHCGN